jgi:hypothetical protein
VYAAQRPNFVHCAAMRIFASKQQVSTKNPPQPVEHTGSTRSGPDKRGPAYGDTSSGVVAALCERVDWL